MLFNLQALRGLAALGVVFYHTDFRLPGDWHTDFSGVAIFFVISGFIMCFITRESADGFLSKRFIRIVPMYWLATLVFVILRYGLAAATSTESPIHVSDLLASLLFFPSEKLPVLGIGWTLNFEIYFYVVFALALWINRRFAPVISAAVIYAVIVLNRNGYGGFLTHYYSHSYIHYFLAGIVLFYLWTFNPLSSAGWPVVALCAAVVVCFFGAQFARPAWPDWMLPWYEWFPPIVVACALFAESSGGKVAWKTAILLGDASYCLYLFHTIFHSVAVTALRALHFPTPGESVAVMIFDVIAATCIGIAIHLYVEKPLLRRIRLALDGSRGMFTQGANPG